MNKTDTELTTETRNRLENACLELDKIPDENKPAPVQIAHQLLEWYLNEVVYR